MSLNYHIKINGVPLEATIGATVYDKLEEALDEAAFHLPITTLGHPEKMLGLLEISASDGFDTKLFHLLIISDDVNLQSKDGFFSHNLTAMEYTHKLDKMFISALSFTKTFLRQGRAPFKFFNASTQAQAPNGYSQIFPKIEFKENYLSNEVVVVNQVGSAFVINPINTPTRTNEDVIIQTNIPGFTSNYNVTTGSRTFTIPSTPGIYYFDVGFMAFPSDVNISGTKVFNKKYRHFITVIQDRKYTLKDMIERVRAVLPIERQSFFNSTRIFDLETTLETLFESIEMPQMFFSNQSARQVLNIIFKYINAISRLVYVDGASDKLTVDFFNKVGSAFDNNDITNFEIVQDAQNYGTKAISFLGNALQSNFRENPSVKTPANNRFKTVRSSNVQLTRDSFELKLEKPIYELSKIEVMFPKVIFTNESETVRNEPSNFVLDLTQRTLEKTFWDLKDRTVDILTYTEEEIFDENVGMRLNQNSNIFWERNGKSIKFNFLVGTIFKNTLLEEVLQEALNEELTLRVRDSDVLGSNFTLSNLPLLLTNPDFEDTVPSNTIFRNVKFNVEYVTLEDTVAQVDRQDLTENDYEAYLRINQSSAISSYERTSRDLFGKLERSAVPIKTISKIHTDIGSILNVGQIDSEGFIITERRLILHNEFIEAVYTVTKNHNRLNEFNGINQAFRAFELPSYNESVKRKDFYNDYVFLVKPTDNISVTSLINLPIMNFDVFGFDLFQNLISNINTYRKATFAIVRTDGFLEQYPDTSNIKRAIMTPVISFGGKGGLNFTFNFESNLIAGDSIVKSVDTISNNFYNQPVWYTDSQGFFDKLWFGIGFSFSTSGNVNLPNIGDASETYFNDEYQYPLLSSTSGFTLGQSLLFNNGALTNPDWFNIFKDPATSYGFSYHLAVLPYDHTDYVIGQRFYTNNALVYDGQKEKTYLYVYPTLTPYGKFDDLKVKIGWTIKIEITNTGLMHSNSIFTFQGSLAMAIGTNSNWAIGDDDGNLLLACNDNTNGFKAITRHLHPKLNQIGNK